MQNAEAIRRNAIKRRNLTSLRVMQVANRDATQSETKTIVITNIT